LAGLLWEEKVEALFQRPLYVAVMLLVTGTWLVLAERLGQRQRSAQDLSWWQSVLVGVAQGVALAPGISRSGSTIGAGLLLGLRREAAARFSFLLAIPIVFGAGLLQVRRLLEASNAGSQLLPLLVGFAAAAGSGYVCIRFLLRYLRQRSLLVFAAYCWLAGLATLLLSLR
jgi:undecaprenyl-diphosphatase